MDKKRQMLSIKELADMLNVSQKTIRRHINSGKIKSVKLGGVHRISREEISTFLEGEEIIDEQIIGSNQNQEFPFSSKVPDLYERSCARIVWVEANTSSTCVPIESWTCDDEEEGAD